MRHSLLFLGFLAVTTACNALSLTREAAKQVGRGDVTWASESAVTTEDAYVVFENAQSEDFTFSFEGRAPASADAEEVGIWAVFRHFNRNFRYMVGVRGAPHSDLYITRYAPDGDDQMLALEPIETVAPGQWVTVKVVGAGKEFTISIDGEKITTVKDPGVSFSSGAVGVGGGYHRAEYRNINFNDDADEAYIEERVEYAASALKINFQPSKSTAPEGWSVDSGEAFDATRGYGWLEKVDTRERASSGNAFNDTLVTLAHKRTAASFSVDVPAGEYLMTLQHGDRFRSSVNCNYGSGEFKSAVDAGVYEEIVRWVNVDEEGLTLNFTRSATGSGTSLNWLVLEPRSELSDERWAAGRPISDEDAVKIALREQQRAAYAPQKVSFARKGRTEVSLDGDWLLLPDYEFKNSPNAQDPLTDDSAWHVMPVPDMWSPYAAWLFGETHKSVPHDKGASDSYFEYRHARVEALTFDWEKTQSAWYRKHVVLPKLRKSQQVELNFGGIAKVSHIFVNGQFVKKNEGMFGDIRINITDQLKAGENVIAVKVDNERSDTDMSDEILGIAISVEVTKKMLNALPHGMTRQDARGIWQSTKLVITEPASIDDVYIQPSLDGADVAITLKNEGDTPQTVSPRLKVVSKEDGSTLTTVKGEKVTIAANSTTETNIQFSGLKPKLWSPDTPYLYDFEVSLKSGWSTVDAYAVTSGFRTFEAVGNRLHLNGHPYALRGANHCPNMLAPNDAELADKFMGYLSENNINSTRFHGLPATDAWIEAADRHGILISHEGTWPWLMLRGPIPEQPAIDQWMEEYQRVIKRYRNSPSVVLWTVNNEMKFHVYHRHTTESTRSAEDNADLLARWKVVSNAVKMIRQTDPTRPIVADSCYVRGGGGWGFDKTPEELGIDDGDIDDRHAYFNWYNRSVFNLHYETDPRNHPDRPYIGQEMSTGYYNTDSGHPVRVYLFAHQTPQSWVGQYAYEHRDPEIFTERHGFLTKELAEYYRRDRREDWAGSLIFGLVTWFKNPWDAATIEPYPVVSEDLRRAMSPVLVSARMTGRNVFAGDTISIPVSIVNDHEKYEGLSTGRLEWSIRNEDTVLSSGKVNTPAVKYYANAFMDVPVAFPETVPNGKAAVELRFDLFVDGEHISTNSYDLTVGEKAWAKNETIAKAQSIVAYKPSAKLTQLLDSIDASVTGADRLDSKTIEAAETLIIDGDISARERALIKAKIEAGFGKVVWVNAGKQASDAFPELIHTYKRQKSEVVTMLVDESPVFDGIDIGEMAWMGGPVTSSVPLSATGGYQVDWKRPEVTVLAEEMRAHGYLKTPTDKLKYWVAPLVKIQKNKDSALILSEMSLDAALVDPIAMRLWSNLIKGDTNTSINTLAKR
ncbi:MAG: glycoside hydrolase family 2 protein [Opitutales bacterium]